MDVGGKLLTNYLKELVSFRQWNMMDEFKLIDQVKEELCFVSADMVGDLKRTKVMRNGARRAVETTDPFGLPLKRNFVLPDFQSIQRGYVKPHDEMMRDSEQVQPLLLYLLFSSQKIYYIIMTLILIIKTILLCIQLLVMETERFCVPEVLFRPQIVGLEQAGVGEALGQSFDRFEHPVSTDDLHKRLLCYIFVFTFHSMVIFLRRRRWVWQPEAFCSQAVI